MGWRVLRGQAGKKGVMTFNRPALTGQGPDRGVRGDRNGPGEDTGGADAHKRLSQSSDQACHPISLSYGLTL